MARRGGVLQSYMTTQREAERERIARQRVTVQVQKVAERAQREYKRARAADEKERQRLYFESQLDEAAASNEQIEAEIDLLRNLLVKTIQHDYYFDLHTLMRPPEMPAFAPGRLGIPETPPDYASYAPPEPSVIQRMLPGAKERYEKATTEAYQRFQYEWWAYQQREQERQQHVAEIWQAHQDGVTALQNEISARNAEVEELKRDIQIGAPQAVADYFALVIIGKAFPDDFPRNVKFGYVPQLKQLVIEYDLPPFSVVPEISAYRYIKSKDDFAETLLPMTQRKALYSNVLAQVTLSVLFAVFSADRFGLLNTVVFNGFVHAIDKGTGRPIRACLVSTRTDRDTFMQNDLSRVDPLACLKRLSASFSSNPAEAIAVRPLFDLSMINTSFIGTAGSISDTDRVNLLEISPLEFEQLIANLFQKMGLETQLTKASHDGGIDCIAVDPRPIIGGELIIQVKRYRHTIGVSVVRDLFGTVQDRRAAKGILVTTSGYGPDSYKFASGKPIELIDGNRLLSLLTEHMGMEARIDIAQEPATSTA